MSIPPWSGHLSPFGSCEDSWECWCSVSSLSPWFQFSWVITEFLHHKVLLYLAFCGTAKLWTVPGVGSMWKSSSCVLLEYHLTPLGEKIHCLVLCLKINTEKRWYLDVAGRLLWPSSHKPRPQFRLSRPFLCQGHFEVPAIKIQQTPQQSVLL